MTTMANSVLNAQEANETIKRVNGNGSGGCVENKEEQREWDCFVMKSAFCFGLVLGIWYMMSDPCKSWLVDLLYILGYFYCLLHIYVLYWDKEEQPINVVKTSLVLSSVLAFVMLLPFIMDMEVFTSKKIIIRDIHYLNMINMVIFFIFSTLRPLYHLYNLCKEEK